MKPADICRNTDERVKKEAEILAKQVVAIGRKLERERKKLKDEPLTIEYDNGGGQTGIRENPFYSSYTRLLSSYTKCLSTLIEIIGESDEEAKDELKTLVDLRSKLKVTA